MFDFAAVFNAAFSYHEFLARYGTAQQQDRWHAAYEHAVLTPPQQALLASFKREMKVLVMAGAWCGDCVDQCPVFQRFAEAAPGSIRLRFVDRDAQPELGRELSVCGAPRVPAVLIMSEDDHPVARHGDRTLAKYRQTVARSQQGTCSTGLLASGEALTSAVQQEWLDNFERAQLILLTSARLREKHGD